jgi:1-deoxy-D-xylulose-5-phosphate reductoisomerase
MKKIGILGSTGSIGTQALDIINNYTEDFELVFISGHTNIKKILEQKEKYNPQHICISDNKSYSDYKKDNLDTNISGGEKALLELCNMDVDLVLNSISGYKGLYLSIELIKNKTDIALSNKESIVQAGSILINLAKENNINIFPVDSEHSALWQCLIGENNKFINKLILTGSGGPFRTYRRDDLYNVTKEQALKHPNWSMGNKITIDSATMMNKGFEVIEAHWLFNIDYKNIDIVIHPESIIHSMVKFIDGSIKAQLSSPSMRIPIQYALSYPNRILSNDIEFDFISNNKFSFEEVDYNKFRCIKLAYQAGRNGGTYPTVLNVANDLSVNLFLNNKIKFLDIEKIIEDSLNHHSSISSPTIDDIKETIKNTEKYIENYK